MLQIIILLIIIPSASISKRDVRKKKLVNEGLFTWFSDFALNFDQTEF